MLSDARDRSCIKYARMYPAVSVMEILSAYPTSVQTLAGALLESRSGVCQGD